MNIDTLPSTPTARGAYRLTYAHFRALDHALLNNNLSAAREAFSSLQEDAPDLAEIVQAAPLPEDSPRRARFKRLAQALRKGELKAAQSAFIQFQESFMFDTHQQFHAKETFSRSSDF